MSIKLTKAQTKSLASGVRRPKYKPREIRTVKNFFNNHEMWKTCPKCGEEAALTAQCFIVAQMFNLQRQAPFLPMQC